MKKDAQADKKKNERVPNPGVKHNLIFEVLAGEAVPVKSGHQGDPLAIQSNLECKRLNEETNISGLLNFIPLFLADVFAQIQITENGTDKIQIKNLTIHGPIVSLLLMVCCVSYKCLFLQI